MLRIVFGGHFLAHGEQAHANNLEALVFKAGQEAASESSVESIWLEQNECVFHGWGGKGAQAAQDRVGKEN